MLEKLYNISPIFFQNFMVSIKGRQFINERYTKHYYEELEILRKNKDVYKLQEQRLNEFLKFAKNNSSYYENKLISFDDSFNINDLNSIPILEKKDLKENMLSIVTRNRKLIKMKTGGSTGQGMEYFSSKSDMSRKFAFLDYFKEQHGVKVGMRRASIGGKVIIPPSQKKKIYWRFNKPLNQLLLSAFHADGENLKYYINKLNSFKPESIDGYPTVIHRLAKYILSNNIVLKFRPFAIFPTAEALTDEMKKDIELAFGCPVRNQYASSEGAPFITENKEGVMQINPETGVFELEHVQENIYELIVTGFYTTTTPLIRYRIGDSVELLEALPENYSQKDIKIKKVIGRNNDFLFSPERGIVTNVNLSTAVREMGNEIIESQFVQNKENEIIVNIIKKNNEKSSFEKRFVRVLNTRFGNDMHYVFNYVESIPKTKGGKTRFTINNLR